MHCGSGNSGAILALLSQSASASHLADALIMRAVVATDGGLWVVLGLASNCLLIEVAPLSIIALHQLFALAVAGLQVGGKGSNKVGLSFVARSVHAELTC